MVTDLALYQKLFDRLRIQTTVPEQGAVGYQDGSCTEVIAGLNAKGYTGPKLLCINGALSAGDAHGSGCDEALFNMTALVKRSDCHLPPPSDSCGTLALQCRETGPQRSKGRAHTAAMAGSAARAL